MLQIVRLTSGDASDIARPAWSATWHCSEVSSPFALTIRSLDECTEVAPIVSAWHWNAWGPSEKVSTEQGWLTVVQARAGSDVPFTLVGFVDDEPVGAVSVCWDDLDHRFEDEGPWVSGMVVRSNARNLGIGRSLLTAAEHRCHALGHGQLWLHTSEAKRFYERCGWRLEADKPGIGRDAVLSKQLALSAES